METNVLPWTFKNLSGFKYDPYTEYDKDDAIHIGSQSVCIWCHAKKWKGKVNGMCGNNGKVQLPALQQDPFTVSLTTITQNRNIYFLPSGNIMHAFKRHHSEPRK
ncbi:hypothetical protein AVEN_181134-1 [Araneus ventricosus]|uniref:Uncharacterized protein n=1 Tax=Araneus ventricosus TaxID=182803 RepID=A0A4Y2HL56_ARAVE|nr:hypothetical protein AVEN_181134-1 [Araneus ventricosus]